MFNNISQKCKSRRGTTLYLPGWLKLKRQTITSVYKSVEKLEPSYTAGEIVNGTTTLENSLAVPQQIKHRVTI